jgi:hypothetical protein
MIATGLSLAGAILACRARPAGFVFPQYMGGFGRPPNPGARDVPAQPGRPSANRFVHRLSDPAATRSGAGSRGWLRENRGARGRGGWVSTSPRTPPRASPSPRRCWCSPRSATGIRRRLSPGPRPAVGGSAPRTAPAARARRGRSRRVPPAPGPWRGVAATGRSHGHGTPRVERGRVLGNDVLVDISYPQWGSVHQAAQPHPEAGVSADSADSMVRSAAERAHDATPGGRRARWHAAGRLRLRWSHPRH